MAVIIARSQLGIPVIDVRGPLHRTDINALHDTVRHHIANDETGIALDLSGCTTMDSAGLGQLVRSFTDCENAGGKLVIIGPLNERVRRKLEITRLDTILSIFDNEPEAVRSLH